MAQHRLIVSVVAAFSCSVGADVVFVDDDNCPGPGSGTELDPFCSIQTAIDNAVDTDEIIVAPGTYFETIDFLGKAITLRSSDGSEVTIIDGTGFFHVAQCVTEEGPDTVLDGFTITGGEALGSFPDSHGGGMLNGPFSSPTVTNCTFAGNTALTGGAMSNSFASPAVTNCTFDGNLILSITGGAMANELFSNPTVTDCTFSENVAPGGQGGGMYNSSSNPTVTNCTFTENVASGGGAGMFNTASSPTVTECTFSGNSHDGFSGGGGMRNANNTVIDGTGNLHVVQCRERRGAGHGAQRLRNHRRQCQRGFPLFRPCGRRDAHLHQPDGHQLHLRRQLG